MSALALRDRPPERGAEQRTPERGADERPRLFALPGGATARTLDDVVSLAFTAVSADAPAECPVCTGRLEPRFTAGARAIGGRCRDCGATLD